MVGEGRLDAEADFTGFKGGFGNVFNADGFFSVQHGGFHGFHNAGEQRCMKRKPRGGTMKLARLRAFRLGVGGAR